MIEIPESTVHYGETLMEWIERNGKQRPIDPARSAAIQAALAPYKRGTNRKFEFKAKS